MIYVKFATSEVFGRKSLYQVSALYSWLVTVQRKGTARYEQLCADQNILGLRLKYNGLSIELAVEQLKWHFKKLVHF